MLFQRRQLLRILSIAYGSSLLFGRSPLGLAAQTAAKPTVPAAENTGMEKVTGIGGFFFRAHDPKGLALWYQQHLGITLAPTSYEAPVWEQEAGQTIFDPFPETTHYFGDPAKVWMINFRVRNLDKMAAQLQATGIAVKIDPQSDSHGRFTRLHDPEGNPIELWQSMTPGTSR
jgi:glyoxylase I family protein